MNWRFVLAGVLLGGLLVGILMVGLATNPTITTVLGGYIGNTFE